MSSTMKTDPIPLRQEIIDLLVRESGVAREVLRDELILDDLIRHVIAAFGSVPFNAVEEEPPPTTGLLAGISEFSCCRLLIFDWISEAGGFNWQSQEYGEIRTFGELLNRAADKAARAARGEWTGPTMAECVLPWRRIEFSPRIEYQLLKGGV